MANATLGGNYVDGKGKREIMKKAKYLPSMMMALLVCLAGCCSHVTEDIAKSGLLGGWPEQITIKVEPINSETQINSLSQEELQVTLEKMLAEMDVEVVEPNAQPPAYQFIINVDLERDPESGLYSYKTKLRFCKLYGRPDDTGGYSVTIGPGEVQTSTSEDLTKGELAEAVCRAVSTEVLMLMTLLFGPDRLDNLSETTLKEIFGEPNEYPSCVGFQ